MFGNFNFHSYNDDNVKRPEYDRKINRAINFIYHGNTLAGKTEYWFGDELVYKNIFALGRRLFSQQSPISFNEFIYLLNKCFICGHEKQHSQFNQRIFLILNYVLTRGIKAVDFHPELTKVFNFVTLVSIGNKDDNIPPCMENMILGASPSETIRKFIY